MSRFVKLAKCPRCLPDVRGAYFDGCGSVWTCRNCGQTLPRRQNKPTPKVTPSQAAVVERLRANGWTVETSFIGRDLWVVCCRELGTATKNLLFGDHCFGTVGPRGAYTLKIWTLSGEHIVNDIVGFEVYLRSH